MPTTTTTTKYPQPAPGQLWSVLDDGRWAFWFDSHTVSDFSKCETYFELKNLRFAPQQLRRKGANAACMTIGSWWSRVSELFYKSVAAWQNDQQFPDKDTGFATQKPNLMDILHIAGQAWVDSGMDAMDDPNNPKLQAKYEKFAIPVRYGEFGKYFRDGSDVEEMFLGQYKRRIHDLRNKAQVASEKHDFDRFAEEARRLEARTALPLGALLMAAQYYDTFAEQDMRDWHIIAAEEPFGRAGDILLGESDEVVVFWQGKPDLVVFDPKTNVLAPIDQKTKDYIPYDIQNIWKPNNQMPGYIFALSQIAGDLGYTNVMTDRCVLSVCGRLMPATPQKKGATPKPRFTRVYPTWNEAELNEWRRGIVAKAERMRFVIQNPHKVTRNEFQCHIYGGCEFRGICSRPEGVRPIVIQSDFVRRDPWTPFEEEED